MNNLCNVPSTVPNRRLAFNEMVALKKNVVLLQGGKCIQVQKDPGWLVKNIFHFQGFVLLGTVPFWNFPSQTPSLTI